MTSELTLKPPSRELFAAVQIETADGTIIGAAPAFRLEDLTMVPLPQVTVTIKPGEPHTARWVHEDSTLGQKLIAIRPAGKGHWT